MSFENLGLVPGLLRAVAEKGYDTPTAIQLRAIPAMLTGGDVLASAQTGTGKTASFVLPLLQKLEAPRGRAPRALVLTPTRELAAQVGECAREYGRHTGLRIQVIFGGVGMQPQIDGLKSGCDLLVATPGRLLDLEEQGVLDLDHVAAFVLDEADRMLDMGFIHAIKRVLRLLPERRQNAMFSATYSDDIRALAARLVREPVAIDVAPRNTVAERIEHIAYKLPKEHKRHLLAQLIKDGDWHQVLVFTRTKHGANRLAEQLEGAGIRSAAIHGNKSQSARVRALADFKANRIPALVATAGGGAARAARTPQGRKAAPAGTGPAPRSVPRQRPRATPESRTRAGAWPALEPGQESGALSAPPRTGGRALALPCALCDHAMERKIAGVSADGPESTQARAGRGAHDRHRHQRARSGKDRRFARARACRYLHALSQDPLVSLERRGADVQYAAPDVHGAVHGAVERA